MIDIIGATKASGLRVLSDEYSKPGFYILVLLILLIVLEFGKSTPLTP